MDTCLDNHEIIDIIFTDRKFKRYKINTFYKIEIIVNIENRIANGKVIIPSDSV